MSERFLKLISSTESDFLQEKHPNDFLLLILIAKRARRMDGHPDGLTIGQAHIGDFEKSGIASRQQYRTALDVLIKRAHVVVIETCRSRSAVEAKTSRLQKSTISSTTKGTLVRILRSDVCDINPNYDNHLSNHRPTTDQPRTRKNKTEEDVSVCMSVKENQTKSYQTYPNVVRIIQQGVCVGVKRMVCDKVLNDNAPTFKSRRIRAECSYRDVVIPIVALSVFNFNSYARCYV